MHAAIRKWVRDAALQCTALFYHQLDQAQLRYL